jgi:hypothetical protein
MKPLYPALFESLHEGDMQNKDTVLRTFLELHSCEYEICS